MDLHYSCNLYDPKIRTITFPLFEPQLAELRSGWGSDRVLVTYEYLLQRRAR